MTRAPRAILFALIVPALLLPDGGMLCLCRGTLAGVLTSCCGSSDPAVRPCCRKSPGKQGPQASKACKRCFKIATGMGQSTRGDGAEMALARVPLAPVDAPFVLAPPAPSLDVTRLARPPGESPPPDHRRVTPLLI